MAEASANSATKSASSPQAIAEMLSELVGIPSVNPLHAGPRSGDGAEAAMSQWLAERTAAMGATVELEEVEPGRHNVYAHFEGQTERTLAVDVHLDTVGVEHMEGDPFDGRIDEVENRVYGRGAVDTKATLAVVLSVLEEMRAEGVTPASSIELVGTVSEEGGGLLGATAYRDRLLASGRQVGQLIVAEPTMCAPVYGHKGGFGMELEIEGRAAHSSAPDLGINAISAAARVVAAIDIEQERLSGEGGNGGVPGSGGAVSGGSAGSGAVAGGSRSGAAVVFESTDGSGGNGSGGGGESNSMVASAADISTSGALGTGTISVTEIAGGRARNIIPDRCELFVGRRTVAGEDPYAEFDRLTDIVRSAAVPARVKVQLSNDVASAAFLQSPNSDLVRTLEELSDQAPTVANFGSNALRYGDVADQIVVFGPGSIDQAHSKVEWVDIAQLELAARIYKNLFQR